jgi:CRP/FNR family transcriptional regulator, cyclic AMP receptor protein
MRKALFFLGILNDEDLEWMIANGHREDIAARTMLIEEGKPIEAVYIVLDGAFTVLVGGKEVGRSLSGEVLGEVSFVDSRPPSATVQAAEASRVLTIPRSLLSRRLEQDTAFAARFYRSLAVFLADRLRSTTGRLGYGQSEPLSEDTEYEDELDPALLDTVSLAGARFGMMLRRLRGA